MVKYEYVMLLYTMAHHAITKNERWVYMLNPLKDVFNVLSGNKSYLVARGKRRLYLLFKLSPSPTANRKNTKKDLLVAAWYKQSRDPQHRGFLIFRAVLDNRNEEATLESSGSSILWLGPCYAVRRGEEERWGGWPLTETSSGSWGLSVGNLGVKCDEFSFYPACQTVSKIYLFPNTFAVGFALEGLW